MTAGESPTPRRTVRFADQPWAAGQAKAHADGETLTDVLRRLLDGYLLDDHHRLDGFSYEYRAIPVDHTLTDQQRAELTVAPISGRYADVRRLYPPRRWRLEERSVSSYHPAIAAR